MNDDKFCYGSRDAVIIHPRNGESKVKTSEPRVMTDSGYILVDKVSGKAVTSQQGLGAIFGSDVKVYRCTLAEYEHVNGPVPSYLTWTPWSTTTTTTTRVG